MIGDGEPGNGLMKQRQREFQLQLDNHRRLVPAHRHHIGSADLALDGIALGFKQRLHRRIKLILAFHAP